MERRRIFVVDNGENSPYDPLLLRFISAFFERTAGDGDGIWKLIDVMPSEIGSHHEDDPDLMVAKRGLLPSCLFLPRQSSRRSCSRGQASQVRHKPLQGSRISFHNIFNGTWIILIESFRVFFS
jgi:hypothetical protein